MLTGFDMAREGHRCPDYANEAENRDGEENLHVSGEEYQAGGIPCSLIGGK